jgi:hypothetical protein
MESLLLGKLSSYTWSVDAVPCAALALIVVSAKQFALWERNLAATRFI